MSTLSEQCKRKFSLGIEEALNFLEGISKDITFAVRRESQIELCFSDDSKLIVLLHEENDDEDL